MRAQLFTITAIAVALGFAAGAVFSFQDNAPANNERPVPRVPHNTREATFVAVGDIMLSRAVGRRIASSSDPRFPFLLAAPFLRDADITFGNLEGPISARGADRQNLYSFRADPKTVEGLAYAGFDMLSLANNHMLDWGPDALIDTAELLRREGMRPVGAGANALAANTPAIFEKNGITFGLFAYSTIFPNTPATDMEPGLSLFSLASATHVVRELARTTDVVIVSFHWGEEYALQSRAEEQEIAHALIDAGADLIVGHHPHVAQEIERYNGGWIAYSLGNFVFDQYFSEETMRGLAIRAHIRAGSIAKLDLFTVQLNSNFQPAVIAE